MAFHRNKKSNGLLKSNTEYTKWMRKHWPNRIVLAFNASRQCSCMCVHHFDRLLTRNYIADCEILICHLTHWSSFSCSYSNKYLQPFWILLLRNVVCMCVCCLNFVFLHPHFSLEYVEEAKSTHTACNKQFGQSEVCITYFKPSRYDLVWINDNKQQTEQIILHFLNPLHPLPHFPFLHRIWLWYTSAHFHRPLSNAFLVRKCSFVVCEQNIFLGNLKLTSSFHTAHK